MLLDPRHGRTLALCALAAALLGGALGSLPPTAPAAAPALALAVVLTAASAWLVGRREPGDAPQGEEGRLQRELAINASSLALLVIFLVLALIELLAIPAALGHLVVFSRVGIGFVTLYPALLALLVGALAGTILLASKGEVPRPITPAARSGALVAAGVTGLFALAAVVASVGGLQALGVRPERASFVLAASLVSLFFFVKAWLRLPRYRDVSAWLERNDRLASTGLLRRIIHGFLGACLAGLVLAILPVFGLLPHALGIAGVGLAMLALMGATFNVGVSHVVPSLEMGAHDDERRKRRIFLGAASIGLTVLGGAVALLTGLALLAQVGGVAIFRFLLDAYVAHDVVIFSIALVPLAAAVFVRTRVKTEVKYTAKHEATAILSAAAALVLVFFGVFIGSGLAEGSGIQMENAVLVLGGAVLALITFVKSRALLPSVVGMMKEAVSTSAQADKTTAQQIRSRMIATYVAGLVFVLTFVAYIVAATLGIAPSPGSSLGTDLGVFLYVLAGLALLIVVGMRYAQSLNIDPGWAAKREPKDIGKKRLTSEQVKRYLILGFSIGTATLLALCGILLMTGAVGGFGPFELEKKYSTDFFVFAILVGLGPYGWYTAAEAKRMESIDQKFPEFLRDLAESQRAGMTLTEAVLTASKGQYGMLTPEIRKMAAQIEWGVSFSDALQRFSKRVDTPLVGRTVSLIIQASEAGGNVVDVLTAAADDAREIQQIVRERKQAMSLYVMIIYIAFAVFIGVIAILNAQFIPEVAKAVEKADGVSIGGLNFRKFDEEDFKTVFFHAAVIQGFGGGIVGGVMSAGKPVHGLRHSFVLVLIAWVLFRLVIG